MFFGHSAEYAGVGAVAESEFIHLCHHGAHTTVFLNLTLRKKSKLAYLRGNEEHGRAVLAGSHAYAPQPMQLAESTASSALTFEIGECVGILCAAAVEADVAAVLAGFCRTRCGLP